MIHLRQHSYDFALYRITIVRFGCRRNFTWSLIWCLHNPANVQQTSSKLLANFQQTSSISTCILNMVAGSLLDRVNTPLLLIVFFSRLAIF